MPGNKDILYFTALDETETDTIYTDIRIFARKRSGMPLLDVLTGFLFEVAYRADNTLVHRRVSVISSVRRMKLRQDTSR